MGIEESPYGVFFLLWQKLAMWVKKLFLAQFLTVTVQIGPEICRRKLLPNFSKTRYNSSSIFITSTSSHVYLLSSLTNINQYNQEECSDPGNGTYCQNFHPEVVTCITNMMEGENQLHLHTHILDEWKLKKIRKERKANHRSGAAVPPLGV